MTHFDGRFARRCDGLSRAAAARWGGELFAPPSVCRRAAGTQPSGTGDYACGDDYRYVDWNRAARLDELVSRQFLGNERRRIMLLLDVSASMSIGQPAKFDSARELVAALGYASLRSCDEVSAACFSESVSACLGPLYGAAGAARLFRFLNGLKTQSGITSLLSAATSVARRTDEPDLAVIVSDLLDPRGWEQALHLLRGRGYDVHVVQYYSPEDARPQLARRVHLEDAETDEVIAATIEERDIANYVAVFQEFCRSIRSFCAGLGLACSQVCSDVPLARAFSSIASSSRKLRLTRMIA